MTSIQIYDTDVDRLDNLSNVLDPSGLATDAEVIEAMLDYFESNPEALPDYFG